MAERPPSKHENIPGYGIKVKVTKPVSVIGYGNVQRIKRRQT